MDTAVICAVYVLSCRKRIIVLVIRVIQEVKLTPRLGRAEERPFITVVLSREGRMQKPLRPKAALPTPLWGRGNITQSSHLSHVTLLSHPDFRALEDLNRGIEKRQKHGTPEGRPSWS